MPKTPLRYLHRIDHSVPTRISDDAHDIAYLDHQFAGLDVVSSAAAGDIEQTLKAIVDDLLPGKAVDVDDNLFDVGASSLALIQIHERIEETWPGRVDLTELFDFPTISQLAKHIGIKVAGG